MWQATLCIHLSTLLRAGQCSASTGPAHSTSVYEEEFYTSCSQLRADQAPNPPWGDRLIYTDRRDATDL